MKFILAITGFCLGFANVFAADTVLLKKTRDLWGNDYSIDFEANPELNRAWVELTISERHDYEADDEVERIKVEGLVYRDGEILFEKDGDSVVCAEYTTSGRWIFAHSYYRETGRCALEEVVKTEPYDDGFYIRDIKRLYLSLVIQ